MLGGLLSTSLLKEELSRSSSLIGHAELMLLDGFKVDFVGDHERAVLEEADHEEDH